MGHLAAGVSLEKVGRLVEQLHAPFRLPPPTEEEGLTVGEVLHVDTYGDLITHLPGAQLLELSARDGSAASVLGAEHGERVHIEPE